MKQPPTTSKRHAKHRQSLQSSRLLILQEYNGNIQRELIAIQLAFPVDTASHPYRGRMYAFKPRKPPSIDIHNQHLQCIHDTTLSSSNKLAALGDVLSEILHPNHFRIPPYNEDQDREQPRYEYSLAFLAYLDELLTPDTDTPQPPLPHRSARRARLSGTYGRPHTTPDTPDSQNPQQPLPNPHTLFGDLFDTGEVNSSIEHIPPPTDATLDTPTEATLNTASMLIPSQVPTHQPPPPQVHEEEEGNAPVEDDPLNVTEVMVDNEIDETTNHPLPATKDLQIPQSSQRDPTVTSISITDVETLIQEHIRTAVADVTQQWQSAVQNLRSEYDNQITSYEADKATHRARTDALESRINTLNAITDNLTHTLEKKTKDLEDTQQSMEQTIASARNEASNMRATIRDLNILQATVIKDVKSRNEEIITQTDNVLDKKYEEIDEAITQIFTIKSPVITAAAKETHQRAIEELNQSRHSVVQSITDQISSRVNTTVQETLDAQYQAYITDMAQFVSTLQQQLTENTQSASVTMNDTIQQSINRIHTYVTTDEFIAHATNAWQESKRSHSSRHSQRHRTRAGAPSGSPSSSDSESHLPSDHQDDYPSLSESSGQFSALRTPRFKKAQARLSDRARETQVRLLLKSLSTFESKPLDDTDFPDEDRHLNQLEFDRIYRNLYDDMTLSDFPLTDLDSLHVTKSCIPTTCNTDEICLRKISSALYKRLSMLVPKNNTRIHHLLNPFNPSRDGYSALYAIARTSLPSLKPTTYGWGPSWKKKDDPSSYVTNLQGMVRQIEHTTKRVYSEREQTEEMLYQAMIGYNFPAGCCKRTEIEIYMSTHPEVTRIPKKYTITELIHYFNDFPVNTPDFPTGTSFNHASIKRIENKRKQFEYKNKVQCPCCQTYGHAIGDQVCRCGATLYHTLKYMKAEPKKFTDNALKFTRMHSRNVVTYISINKTIFDIEAHEEAREEIVKIAESDTNTLNPIVFSLTDDRQQSSLVTIPTQDRS